MKLKQLLEELGAWPIDETMERNAQMDFEVVFEDIEHPSAILAVEEIEWDPRAGILLLRG